MLIDLAQRANDINKYIAFLVSSMTSGTEAIAESRQQLNLQEFVKNATWRELLVELVDSNKLDPWNIDIVNIVDELHAVVRKMRVMDLHIPANIVLAASILLRMKSETISILQTEEIAVSGRTMEQHREINPGSGPCAKAQAAAKAAR